MLLSAFRMRSSSIVDNERPSIICQPPSQQQLSSRITTTTTTMFNENAHISFPSLSVPPISQHRHSPAMHTYICITETTTTTLCQHSQPSNSRSGLAGLLLLSFTLYTNCHAPRSSPAFHYNMYTYMLKSSTTTSYERLLGSRSTYTTRSLPAPKLGFLPHSHIHSIRTSPPPLSTEERKIPGTYSFFSAKQLFL